MAEENRENQIWLTKYGQNWWQYVLSVESLYESIGDWPDNTDVVVEFVPNPEGILKVARLPIFKGCITIGDPATFGRFFISPKSELFAICERLLGDKEEVSVDLTVVESQTRDSISWDTFIPARMPFAVFDEMVRHTEWCFSLIAANESDSKWAEIYRPNPSVDVMMLRTMALSRDRNELIDLPCTLQVAIPFPKNMLLVIPEGVFSELSSICEMYRYNENLEADVEFRIGYTMYRTVLKEVFVHVAQPNGVEKTRIFPISKYSLEQ
jgi:hypothetical protein